MLKNIKERKWIIPERMNNYLYKGKLSDYDEYMQLKYGKMQ